jgi:hypothetical protein
VCLGPLGCYEVIFHSLEKGDALANPELQIEQRVSKLEERLNRVEEALGIVAQTSLDEQDVEEVEGVLRGEKVDASP